MGAPVILAVDDDEWVILALRVCLQNHGFEVLSAPDGWDALALAAKRTPDLVITDVIMPRMDGWAFVKQLRSKSQFALVPVIFLTTQATVRDRVRGFRLGADDYIAKPVDTKELPARVARALDHARRMRSEVTAAERGGTAGSAGTLKGTIDQMGLASLLSVLELGRRSGILQVRRGDEGTQGLLYLVDGNIHRAEVAGDPKLLNAEAVYAVLGWSQGTFEFTPASLRAVDEVASPTASLLLEGARRMDESQRAP